MPGQLRPIPKMSKVLYRLMHTPKELQQKNTENPTERQRREWATTKSPYNVR